MINPKEIQQKALKKYAAFLRVTLLGSPFFPLEIPFRKPAATINYMQLSQWVADLLDGAKAEKGYGYTVHMQKRETRRYGTQSIPQRITIDTAADFLKLIGKQREFSQVEEAAALIRSQLPELESWLCQHPQRVVDNLGQWPGLLSVCVWFMQNPHSNLYIREIPVDVHTKFVEENRGILRLLLDELLPQDAISQSETDFEKRFRLRFDEPLIRVRLLDPQLQIQLNWPATDLSIPLFQFAKLGLSTKQIIITENKMTFLTLPSMLDTIAIWGGGFKVIGLGNVGWMQRCPILYWGDLDVQGFEILSGLRAHFPQTRSLLMDRETLDAFKHFVVQGKASATQKLANLTAAEETLHCWLYENQLRLEQERIPLSYLVECLQRTEPL